MLVARHAARVSSERLNIWQHVDVAEWDDKNTVM